MTQNRRVVGILGILVLLYALLLPPLSFLPSRSASASENPKRVLLLFAEDQSFPFMTSLGQSIQSTLKTQAPASRFEFYSEYLDQVRIPDFAYESELVQFWQKKYEGRNIDLIIVCVASALELLSRHQDEIFPGVPVVFCVLSQQQVLAVNASPNVTGVWSAPPFRPTMELVLRLHPDTRRVVVVSGSDKFDRGLLALAKQDFQEFGNAKIEVEYLVDLTIGELQQRLANLPKHTIVIHLSLAKDRAGVVSTGPEIVPKVASASNAPVYGISRTYLGSGIVGGSLISYEDMGARAAEIGSRILVGERPQDIAPQSVPTVLLFDWREMRRWGVSENSLPPGSIVRFKEFSVWESYKWHIIAAISLLILEALLIVALLINLRRRRHAEEDNERLARLAEGDHQRLDEVISNVPGIVWESHTAQGTNRQLLSFVSEYVVKMLGYSVEEWLSTPGFAMTIVAEEDRERAMRESQAILESGKDGILQFRWVTKDGRILWVESQVTAINDEGGKPIGLRGVTMDVTDRKRAEQEASHQRSELAHLSRVTMLGELSGSLAHELNQPLMAILSNAQAAQRFLAHDNVDLDEVRDILNDIVDQDKRAGEVIHRLRLLLKKGKVEQQRLDVNSAVQEVLKLIRGDLSNQGVTTLTKFGPALPTVKGDRVQLQQVLLNLVMNACDAMKSNAPTDREIVVSTELSDGAGVCFSVSDRGSGLPAGELEQVFEPFFTSKPHGLGLGLSVCRSIVTAHGGKLWAANNPERGATFHFTLPVNSEASL